MSKSIDIEISSNFSENGEEIEATFFGGNILFARDEVHEGSSFNQKVEALNIDFIRYPGGGVTNKLFDLTDPNKDWDANARSGFLTPLSDFVQYAAENEKKYALVLPVERYMTEIQAGEKTLEGAIAELAHFLSELADGAYGDLLPDVIEIGNEFYWNEFTGSRAGDAHLYAEVAHAFAEEVRAEMGDTAKIAIQATPYSTSNAIVVQEFAASPDLVDMLVIHNYPNQIDQIDKMHARWMGSVAAWERAGIEAEIFLSEWNTATNVPSGSGSTIETSAIEKGLAGAIAMIELAAQYIADGVDYATVWPLQQNTVNDLGGNAGDLGDQPGSRLTENGLTLKGEVFRAMSESLVGKQVIDTETRFDLDHINEGARFKHELYLRAYEDESEIVLFVSAWDNSEKTPISVNLGTGFYRYETMRITVNDGHYYRSNEEPVIETETHINAEQSSIIDLAIKDSFEIIRVTVQKIDPLHTGTNEDDVIYGAASSDLLIGYEGDDHLSSGQGRDTVDGGTGDDTISGGGDRDTLNGGDGNDRLMGSKGSDRLSGGDGSDILIGGRGRDFLNGEAGADKLFGGVSHDFLLGGAGNDALKGHGGDDKMYGGKNDDLIDGGKGSDVIFGQHGDDTLIGGHGDDILNPGGGKNQVFGGEGDDVFMLGSGREDLIYGGAGADQFVFGETNKGETRISDFNYTEDELVVEAGSVVNVERMGFEWLIQTENHDIIVYDIYHHTTFDSFFDLM